MSKESAKAYIERLQNDGDFAGQVARCKDAAERMKLVRQEGFDFTPEEIREVAAQQKLTEEELQKVAGGSGGCCLESSGPGEGDSLCNDTYLPVCTYDYNRCERIDNFNTNY